MVMPSLPQGKPIKCRMSPSVGIRDNSATSWLCYPPVLFGRFLTDAVGRITSDRTAMTTKRAGLSHRDPTAPRRSVFALQRWRDCIALELNWHPAFHRVRVLSLIASDKISDE
jgi:hypothetical protein